MVIYIRQNMEFSDYGRCMLCSKCHGATVAEKFCRQVNGMAGLRSEVRTSRDVDWRSQHPACGWGSILFLKPSVRIDTAASCSAWRRRSGKLLPRSEQLCDVRIGKARHKKV